MKIKCNIYNDNRMGEEQYVYAVYFSEGKIKFVCSPMLRKGFIVFDEKDIDISEPNLGPNFVSVFKDGEFIIMHKILNNNKLFERVSESEPGAYEEFVSMLGREP